MRNQCAMETVFTHHLCVFPHPHDAYVQRLFGARDPTNCKCVPLALKTGVCNTPWKLVQYGTITSQSLRVQGTKFVTIFADFGPPRTVFNHVRLRLLVLFFLLFISFIRVFDAVCLAGRCFCVYFYLFFIDFILFQAPRKYEWRRTDWPMYEWNFHKCRLLVITKRLIVLQIQNSFYKTNLPNQS